MSTGSYTPDSYTSTGLTDTYTYTFEIPTENDIDVYLDGTLQTLTTHYTVTGAGSDSGGNVVFVSTPAADVVITFKRSVSETRTSDFQQSGDFKASVINDELDRLTMRDAELSETFDRVPKFSETSTTTNITFPEPSANKAVVWNAGGTDLENSTVDFDDVVADAEAAKVAAEAAQSAAETAQTNAETAETNAETAETNATTQASNAAASALAAATAAASNLYSTVTTITTGTTDVEIVNDGTLYLCDTSSGNIAINLPSIGSDEGTRFGFQKVGSSNTVSFVRDGTDTINGGTSYSMTADTEVVMFIADDATPDNWIATVQSQTVAGSGLSKSGSTISLDLTNDQSWTGSQRATPVTDNDGSFDMNAGNDFVWTPTGTDTLEFTNEATGQRGCILLDNSSGYTISLGSEVEADADCATTLSAAGKYQIGYWCYDGTNVAISYSGAIS